MQEHLQHQIDINKRDFFYAEKCSANASTPCYESTVVQM